jgi:hypothetical protein
MRLAVAIGFAALQAILATTSLAKTSVVHHRSARQHRVPTAPIVEAGAFRPRVMRRTQRPSRPPDTTAQTHSPERALSTKARFLEWSTSAWIWADAY